MEEFGRPADRCAGDNPECLVAKADPEHRLNPLRTRLDHCHRDTRLLGSSGAGRNEDAVETRAIARGDRVVADDLGLGTELLQVPDDREHKTVVVVDNEDPGHARMVRLTLAATSNPTGRDTQVIRP